MLVRPITSTVTSTKHVEISTFRLFSGSVVPPTRGPSEYRENNEPAPDDTPALPTLHAMARPIGTQRNQPGAICGLGATNPGAGPGRQLVGHRPANRPLPDVPWQSVGSGPATGHAWRGRSSPATAGRAPHRDDLSTGQIQRIARLPRFPVNGWPAFFWLRPGLVWVHLTLAQLGR